jgi:CheY-specific phosphatase CheX
MNKAEKFEIFRKLDSLFSYSELLPDEFRGNFKSDLEDVRKRISEHKCSIEQTIESDVNKNTSSNNSTFMFKPLTEEEKLKQKQQKQDEEEDKKKSISPPPPLLHNINAFTNYGKKGTAPLPPLPEFKESKILTQTENLNKKSGFESITSIIIPKLTESGKKLIGDLSVPINHYLVIKAIDDKSNLYKLFENYNKKHAVSFIEFGNIMYALELDKHISYEKTENSVKDMGIIKLEEIIEFGKVVPESNLLKAVEYQKAKSLPFIGKALVDLKYLSESDLGICMKIQKWVSRTIEKSDYVPNQEQEIIETNSQTSKSGVVLPPVPTGIKPVSSPLVAPPIVKEEKPLVPSLNFIIPIFNNKGQEILQSPEHKALADRIKIIDGTNSILDNYWTNRESFKKNIFAFIKFIMKLDTQDIFNYRGNSSLDEKIIWVRFGELINSFSRLSQIKINQSLEYSEENNCYIGEAIVKLGFMEQNEIDEFLKIQNWINNILSLVSYERAFVDAIQSVLKSQFKCNVDIGNLRKVSFQNPLKDIVYIKYNISGKLNGRVFYISDKAFMQRLANTLMSSVGSSSQEFDESYVATVCTVIISNSLTKLAQMGMFSSSDIPKIIMEKEVVMDQEIIVADRNTISMIPLNNEFGRFAIGLELT